MDNLQWSQKTINKFSPLFKPRWEVYTDTLLKYLDKSKVWIDLGCGFNNTVLTHQNLVKQAIGVDVVDCKESNFIKADIRHIPLPSDYADIVTLRFVAEHFENKHEYINEIKRVLKKRGILIILTTNLLSPFIFIPKILLPYSLKNKILTKLFKVNDEDVFPTYHKLNTPASFESLKPDFNIIKMIFISDLNATRKWVFYILFIWHKFTQKAKLEKLQTNLLVILEKQ